MSQYQPTPAQKNFIDTLNQLGQAEPVMIGSAVAALVTASLGLASSFGYVFTGDQVDAIFYMLSALILCVGVWQRSRVSPVATVAAKDEEIANQAAAIEALKADHQAAAIVARKSRTVEPRRVKIEPAAE